MYAPDDQTCHAGSTAPAIGRACQSAKHMICRASQCRGSA
jgi:hypothetical protein